MRILNKPQTKLTSYHFSFFSCIIVHTLDYYIYRPTIRCLHYTLISHAQCIHQTIIYIPIRCLHHRLLYIHQPSDVPTVDYYIQTNHQMSPLQTIIYRPTVRCLQCRLLYIDQPSDVSTLDYYIQTNHQVSPHQSIIYRPPTRCLQYRLLYIVQPPDASTVHYYIQTNRQMPTLQTNLYDWTYRCYWLDSKTVNQSEWRYVIYPIIAFTRKRTGRYGLLSVYISNSIVNKHI